MNATGERLYKITGVNSSDQLNGGYGSAKIDFDEATLYPFQYLTIKPRGYTKHYFIGKEHIATTFGNGGFEKITPNTERKPETVHESQLMYWFYNMQWNDPYVFRTNTIGETTKNIDYQGIEHSYLQYNCNPTIVADLYASWRPRLHNVIGNNLGILNRKQESYFYHNDHLGSTNLVAYVVFLPPKRMYSHSRLTKAAYSAVGCIDYIDLQYFLSVKAQMFCKYEKNVVSLQPRLETIA